jgi:hypothetical protein
MNYNSDLPGGKQATKGDKKINGYINKQTNNYIDSDLLYRGAL